MRFCASLRKAAEQSGAGWRRAMLCEAVNRGASMPTLQGFILGQELLHFWVNPPRFNEAGSTTPVANATPLLIRGGELLRGLPS